MIQNLTKSSSRGSLYCYRNKTFAKIRNPSMSVCVMETKPLPKLKKKKSLFNYPLDYLQFLLSRIRLFAWLITNKPISCNNVLFPITLITKVNLFFYCMLDLHVALIQPQVEKWKGDERACVGGRLGKWRKRSGGWKE